MIDPTSHIAEPGSFRAIIELWPTRIAFAGAVGIDAGRASIWWQRDKVPPDYFTEVVEACAAIGNDGVTLAVLHRLLDAKKRKGVQKVRA